MEKLSSNRLSQVSTGSTFDSCLRFECKGDLQAKKMDEMKARMAQMEKSMRWWNECANNWRLKWSEVRNERNKLKDECRTLKYKLEDVEKQYALLQSQIEKFTSEASFIKSAQDNKELQNIEKLRIHTQGMTEMVEENTFSNELKCESFHNITKVGNDKSTDTSYLDLHLHICECESMKFEELSELRNAHRQLKKVLQDKCGELSNALRKADAYENEMKKLRLKTDELKKELVVAEDHADNASNTIRKLQRTNDRLQEQMHDFRTGMNSVYRMNVALHNCRKTFGTQLPTVKNALRAQQQIQHRMKVTPKL